MTTQPPTYACPRGPTLLKDVAGFPACVATHLHEVYGVNTLDDLAKDIDGCQDNTDLPSGPMRQALAAMQVDNEQVAMSLLLLAGEQRAKTINEEKLHNGEKPKKERKPRAKKPKAGEMTVISETGVKVIEEDLFPAEAPIQESFPPPLADVATFDETTLRLFHDYLNSFHPLADVATFDATTPPPKAIKPTGELVPRYVVLKAGETPLGKFLSWLSGDSLKRGAILVQFVGTGLDGFSSGYKLAHVETAISGVGVGDMLLNEQAKKYRSRTVIRDGGGLIFGIWEPREDGK